MSAAGELGEEVGLGWLIYAADMNDPDVDTDHVAGGLIIHEGWDPTGHPVFSCLRIVSGRPDATTLRADQIVTMIDPASARGEAMRLYRAIARYVARQPRGDPSRDLRALRWAVIAAGAA